MKAVVIDRNGGLDALEFRDVPVPEPATGEALVRLEASGVNFIDVYVRSGVYKSPHFPLVLGQEGAGVVEALGAGVTTVRKGDRVAFAGTPGAYAEFAAVPAERLVAVPDGVSTRDAAALMLQGMTAHYLCNSTYPLRAGEFALVHAAAGGVGLLLTQLAVAKGATVIATVSTPEKAALAASAGAAHTILYTECDFAPEARRLSGGAGVHVVYDSVGLTTFEKSLDALRPRGTLAIFGASSGAVPPFDVQELNRKGSLYVTRPSLGAYVATREELEWRARDLFAGLLAGTLRLRVAHTYSLADAARAHADLESRRTSGKLLLLQ